MQLKQLFHMLRAAAPDEPAPKATPKGAGGNFAAVLSGTLDADALREAPQHVRKALHGIIRQAADGKNDSPGAGLSDGLADALRHSLEALLKEASSTPASDGPAEATPNAGEAASDAPRLVLKADGTVELQVPPNRATAEGETRRPSSGRAPGDIPRYTQPGGPKAQQPVLPADHRVRLPKAPETAKAGHQPTPQAADNASVPSSPQGPRLSAAQQSPPNADSSSTPEPAAPPAPRPTAISKPATAAVSAAVEEALTHLATGGTTEIENTKARTAARTRSTTEEAASPLQKGGKVDNSPAQPGTPAATASAASPASTTSTPFPAEAAPVLYASDGTPTDQGTAAKQPTPQPTPGTAPPTGVTPEGAGEAPGPDAKRSPERGSRAPTTSAEHKDAVAHPTPTTEPRTSNPPATEKPTSDPSRPAAHAPAPSAAPVAEALPDDASANVRLEATAPGPTEQAPTTRTDGGGVALRVDGEALLQPRPTAPASAGPDAAPASGTSADGGTPDQDGGSDPQQRHRDAQALQQALRLARQNGAAAPPITPPGTSDFSPSLSEALATLSSDTPAVTTTEDADGEAQLLRHALEGVLSELKPSRTTPTSRTAAPGASQANMNAWMKSLMNQPARAFALHNGWQVLQIQLEDGQGSLTVSARRDDDSMAVSVGFTDPALRGQAAAHAGRIQDALQDQYQTQVDFSLQDETQERSSHDRSTSGRTTSPLRGSDNEPDSPSSAASSSVRAALLGANHEWIA